VELTPQEEQPKPVNEEKPPDQETPPEVTPDVPVVATVVAADPKAVAFAVPVNGPVILAPARYAAPPPPAAPPRPTTFIPGQGEKGSFPWPRTPPREAYEKRVPACKLML